MNATLDGKLVGQLAGTLLVGGFLALALGVGAYRTGAGLGHWLISAAIVLTLVGLGQLTRILWHADDRRLGPLGLIAFAVATALWVANIGIEYGGKPWVFELELGYVLFACLSIAAYGAALLLTGILPRWAGWVAIGWGVTWAVLYPPRVLLPPLGPNLIPLVFGVLLLTRWYAPPTGTSRDAN